MSRVNFDTLILNHPESADRFRSLQEWIDNHPTIKFLDVAQVVRAVSSLTPEDVAEALHFLSESGYGHREYRIQSPDGILIGTGYNSINQIPKSIPNRFGNFNYLLTDCEVISGIKLEASSGARE